ncbi:MAG: lamin tail domain-containing protein, partial [Myxococcales bacterium]|nr:lamin tail domain-containing protein [Myxococcales bacterium]
GEWFELYNPGNSPVVLNGLNLASDVGEMHRVAADGPVAVAPGEYAVLARAAMATGAVPPAYVYAGITFENGGDRLALLDPFGAVIDEVTYGEGWPVAAGVALSLGGDPDAAANDAPDAWCAAVGNFGGEDRGTPGAANPACAGPEPIDWCRLQWPLDVETVSGAELTAYGRVFEAGVTDRTDATDVDARLLAQFGFGPDGTEPAGNGDWAWVDAAANAGWNAADAGEPGNDEYQVTVAAPAMGVYDHAFRFSADGGLTWTYCDRAVEGSDGAADGYQVANAGSLTVTPGPCDANPCVEAPAATCDGNAVVTYAAAGVCTPDGEGFTCAYPEAERVDCAANQQVCTDGACVEPEPLAAPGEIVITEILYDSHGPLLEDNAEWFEVYNRADGARRLDGCTMVDANPDNAEIIPRLAIPAGGYAVFVRSADLALNGGIEADATFGFALNNSGDTITIQCGDQIIDQVVYDDGAPFPLDARYQSIQLDPALLDGVSNDDGASWCYGDPVYYEDPLNEADNHRGTPGAANPPCPIVDVQVDWCRLQSPLDVEASAATPLTVFGRVFEAGITDESNATDADEALLAEVGFGP